MTWLLYKTFLFDVCLDNNLMMALHYISINFSMYYYLWVNVLCEWVRKTSFNFHHSSLSETREQTCYKQKLLDEVFDLGEEYEDKTSKYKTLKAFLSVVQNNRLDFHPEVNKQPTKHPQYRTSSRLPHLHGCYIFIVWTQRMFNANAMFFSLNPGAKTIAETSSPFVFVQNYFCRSKWNKNKWNSLHTRFWLTRSLVSVRSKRRISSCSCTGNRATPQVFPLRLFLRFGLTQFVDETRTLHLLSGKESGFAFWRSTRK